MIALDRVGRRFGPQELFRDLSWLIPPKARVGLVGPNGAGKTTLLRLLAGIDRPDEGAVHRPSRSRVGYLPQEVETLTGGSVLSTVLDGFPEIRALEDRLEHLEREMSTRSPGDRDLPGLTSAYGETRHRFEVLGGDEIEVRAKAILTGLGVAERSFHDPLDRLSGGWRMRVVLARLLLGAPDLLLLDEPTNHLDLEAIDWLERFLETYEGAYVVVSHDRYFLNRMVRDVAELDRGRLTHFAGNYDDYLAAKELREAQLEKAARQQERDIARAERFIERFRYKATKARQVQSRIRALSKVESIETEKSAKRIRFGFPPAPRSGDIVLRAENVRKSYGPVRVYDGLDLLLRRGDRVALVGPNGAGKSTLLKLIAGTLEPDGGLLQVGHNVHLQYYAQHQLDALRPSATVLEEIQAVAPPGMVQRLRDLLGGFLFHGEDVDKTVAVLSGGEKARLALARMLIHPSNLFLLDEPTNHLDLRSREVLEDALAEYDGTLVVISHDRYFINRTVDRVAEVGGGRVRMYEGDYDTYLEQLRLRQPAGAGAGEAAAGSAMDGSGEDRRVRREREREERRREAEERNRRYRERRRVEERLAPVEREIGLLEKRIEELTALQAAHEVYSSADRAREVGREKAEAEQRLGALYARWEELAEDPGD